MHWYGTRGSVGSPAVVHAIMVRHDGAEVVPTHHEVCDTGRRLWGIGPWRSRHFIVKLTRKGGNARGLTSRDSCPVAGLSVEPGVCPSVCGAAVLPQNRGCLRQIKTLVWLLGQVVNEQRTDKVGVGRRLARGVAIVVALGYPRVGQAEPALPTGTKLSFVRAENAQSCSSAPAIEREVVRRMGRDPFVGAPRQWVEGTISKVGDSFQVELFERDARGDTIGTRTLRETVEDCHRLDDAIVLAIALIIDPTAPLVPTQPSRDVFRGPMAAKSAAVPQLQPQIQAKAPGVAEPTAPDAQRAAPTSINQSRYFTGTSVAINAVVLHGALPGVAPGVELVTKLALPSSNRYALRVSALYLPEKRLDNVAGAYGFGLSALEAGVCANAFATRISWDACAAFGMGAIHAVVHNPAPLEPGDRLWTSFRLESGAALRIAGPVWLNARLFGLVTPRRWDFRVKGPGSSGESVFLQSYLTPGAALGLSLSF